MTCFSVQVMPADPDVGASPTARTMPSMMVRSNQSRDAPIVGGFYKQRIVEFIDVILVEQGGIEAG